MPKDPARDGRPYIGPETPEAFAPTGAPKDASGIGPGDTGTHPVEDAAIRAHGGIHNPLRSRNGGIGSGKLAGIESPENQANVRT